MLKTESYSVLWGYGNHRATRDYSPFKTNLEARQFRDAVYKEMRKRGIKARRYTLTGQVRQYWGFGDPCGHSCVVYELEYEVS